MKKVLNTLFLIIFTSFFQEVLTAPLSTSDVEIITALARGPLASLSQHYHKDNSAKAKFVHCATNLIRLVNEITCILNHPGHLGNNKHAAFWAVFDLISFIKDLRTPIVHEYDFVDDTKTQSFQKQGSSQQEDDLDNDDDTTNPHETSKLEAIVRILQTYLLPFAESATTFLVATNSDQTEYDHSKTRCLQAFCSFSRALSVYLNNKKSIPAIALLAAATGEAILAIHQVQQKAQEVTHEYQRQHEEQLRRHQEQARQREAVERQQQEQLRERLRQEAAERQRQREEQQRQAAERLRQQQAEVERLRRENEEWLRQIQQDAERSQQAREAQLRLREEIENLRRQGEAAEAALQIGNYMNNHTHAELERFRTFVNEGHSIEQVQEYMRNHP